MNKELGTLVAIITHNEAISGIADRVVRLADGKVRSVEANQKLVSLEDIRW